jgi:DNA sulfur modification protein DndD
MILERLVIHNFRQFKGEQEIIFSDNREKNITLIHAENGFGKTTLLNAILWALYGHRGLTGDFEGQDQLINNGLAHEYRKKPNEIETLVQLTFKHDGARYILNRALSLAEQRADYRKDRLTLDMQKDGQTLPGVDRPQHRIQAILPDGISKFLFFNGERINELGLDKNSDQVTEAIHQMLGLNLLKRTIEDLDHPNVLGKFRKELKENTSDEKRDLLAQVETLENKRDKHRDDLQRTKEELVAVDNERELIEAKLEANKEVHKLQATRANLERERKTRLDKRDEISKRLSKIITDDGFTLFTPEMVKRGKEIMATLRERNMIPAPVLDSFLQDLLEEGKCICERCLEPGSPEYEAVQKHLSQAPDQDFNNAVSALDHAVGILEKAADTTRDQLTQLNSERLELSQNIKNLEGQLEDIHQRIGSGENEAAQKLEEARTKQVLKHDELQLKRGRLEGDIDSCIESIADFQKRIQAMEDKEDRATRAQKRLDAVEECKRVLSELLQSETEELRPILNAEISTHFSKIIDRDYWAELTEDFELRIRQNIGGDGDDSIEQDVALSTGQRQVKLLVFIASLLALARRRSEFPTIVKDLSGSEYPLVTDAPFGNISVFRAGISRWIPNLAPQVTILLTPGQYDGSVEKALKEAGRVGKRYYLAYHGPENQLREGAHKNITVEGTEYQQYFEAENEFTQIKELG